MQGVIKRILKCCLRLLPLVLITANLAGIIGPGAASADPGWYDSNWNYRKKITINAANVTADLTNFPVLISIANDSGLGAHAQLDGDDILFTDNTSAKLDHEIEKYSSNGITANLTAWVKVPSVQDLSDTDIYLYYGNSGAASQQNAAGVWDSDYRMVQHMEETAGGANAVKDSTVYGNNGTDAGSPVFNASGKVDGGISFDGIDDRINIDYGTGINVTRPLTIEAWIRPATVPGLNTSEPVIFRDNGTNMNYAFSVANGASYTGGTGVKMNFWREDATDADFNTYGATTIAAGNWYHVVVVDNGSQGAAGNFIIYVNGGAEGAKSITMTAYDSVTHKTVIADTNGETIGSGHFFNGIIDEVRISSTARSADWIKTGYNNQSNPSTFITLGVEQNNFVLPTLSTDPASSIEEISAALTGAITATGGENASERGFQWSTNAGFTPSSNWTEAGSFGTGSFSHAVNSLNQGQLYYYRAIARNSAGWGIAGDIETFLTKPDAPSGFSATANGSSQIDLVWTKGSGAGNTFVLRKAGSAPANRADGMIVYSGPGASFSDMGLSANTTCYYWAWSEITVSGNTQYSDAEASASAQTAAAPPAPASVGGKVFTVNKAIVIAPWCFLVLFCSLAVTWLIIRIRKKFLSRLPKEKKS